MPALIPTSFYGNIIWLGVVVNRKAALESAPVWSLQADFAGPVGDAHSGLTRLSDSRVTSQYPKGVIIRNVRQFSILGAEDLAAIASKMGISSIDPALVGASMVIEGLPDFSHIPPSSRLQGEGGATLVVDMVNRPCSLPAKPIDARFPGFGKSFKAAAVGRRGVTAWVEREGVLRLGERVRLHVPDQPVWRHLGEAHKTT